MFSSTSSNCKRTSWNHDWYKAIYYILYILYTCIMHFVCLMSHIFIFLLFVIQVNQAHISYSDSLTYFILFGRFLKSTYFSLFCFEMVLNLQTSCQTFHKTYHTWPDCSIWWTHIRADSVTKSCEINASRSLSELRMSQLCRLQDWTDLWPCDPRHDPTSLLLPSMCLFLLHMSRVPSPSSSRLTHTQPTMRPV